MIRSLICAAVALAAMAFCPTPANAGLTYSLLDFEINEGGRHLTATLVTDISGSPSSPDLLGHVVSWDIRIVDSHGVDVDVFNNLNSVMDDNTLQIDVHAPNSLLQTFPLGTINFHHVNDPPNYTPNYLVGINASGEASNTEAPVVGGFVQYDQQLYGGSWTVSAHSVPEPLGLTMVVIGSLTMLGCAWRRRRTAN